MPRIRKGAVIDHAGIVHAVVGIGHLLQRALARLRLGIEHPRLGCQTQAFGHHGLPRGSKLPQQQRALAFQGAQLRGLLLGQRLACGYRQRQHHGIFRQLIAKLQRVAHGDMTQRQGRQAAHHIVRLPADAREQLHLGSRVRRYRRFAQFEPDGLQVLLRFQHALRIGVLQGLGASLGPVAVIQREKNGYEHRHTQKGIQKNVMLQPHARLPVKWRSCACRCSAALCATRSTHWWRLRGCSNTGTRRWGPSR